MTPSSLCTALLFLLSLTSAIASPAQTVKTFSTLLSFDGSDGETPAYLASLVQGLDGNLYGTTHAGGANSNGTVFKITPAGTLTTLYNFCAQANCTDGKSPEATLALATNGTFYGTTFLGGSTGCDSGDFSCGTVFKITPSGALTTLHGFDGNDGGNPSGGLVEAANGTFYGTTHGGGSSSNCKNVGGCGTIFKITPAGTLTTLYSFCAQANCTDDAFPGGLVLATNGNFYGTTGGLSGDCGSGGCGTVFKITPSGTLTTLHRFDGTDGGNASAGLVQDTNGAFYGATSSGGSSSNCSGGCGTVFRLSVGRAPFVETLPT